MESDKSTTNPEHDDYLLLQELFMKGDDIQKISVIQAIPQLLQTNENETLSKIIPKIHQELMNASCEFHLAASKMYRILVENKYPVKMMNALQWGIDSKDLIVCNAWIDTLLAILPLLEKDIVMNEVLPLAASKSLAVNTSNSYRTSSCRILGLISVHPELNSYEVKKNILPLVLSLCQDYSHDVRGVMCIQLPKVAEGLRGDVAIKTSILPSLVELCSDDYINVKSDALDTLVLMIQYLDAETIKDTIVPLVKQIFVNGTHEDGLSVTIAKVYGPLIENLSSCFRYEECLWFLEYFRDLSRKGSRGFSDRKSALINSLQYVTCRQYCAVNLPVVTSFTISQVPDQLLDVWYITFKSLTDDSCFVVRKTVASVIHEIARILGRSNHLIPPEIVKLLRDDADEVLESLIPNIGITIQYLNQYNIINRDQLTQASLGIGRGLVKCETDIFKMNNWRIKTTYLKQLEILPKCMPSDFVHQNFTHMLLRIALEGKAKPVRSQAAKTLLIFLRYNSKAQHRKWIYDNLITQFCQSKSCYTRHIFIETCKHAIDIFSAKYFKEFFFMPLLSLTQDSVSTVRYSVVKIIPSLFCMFVMSDHNLKQYVENILYKLDLTEKDRDVMEIVGKTLKELNIEPILGNVYLLEEKRKIEEEERIAQGLPIQMKIPDSQMNEVQQVILTKEKIIPRGTRSIGSRVSQTSNSLSFLEQNFCIDIKDDKDESVIPTVSAENICGFSKKDLEQLETITTNLTDDVKVNLKKITSKSLSKIPPASTSSKNVDVKKRNKRYSIDNFATEMHHNENNSVKTLKRRSLNITLSDVSRIPVCNGNRKCMNRSKSVLDVKNESSRFGKCERAHSDLTDRGKDIVVAATKENVPISPAGANKPSNLPVYVRRTKK